MLKSLADEDHHYSKFSTGNRITLPACAPEGSGGGGGDGNVDPEPGAPNVAEKHPLEDIVRGIGGGGYNRTDAAEFVRAALLAFHERHYRPKNMTAVVVGPQSLDELESWAVPRFGRIPDRWASEEEEQGEGDDDDDAAAADDAEKWRATKRAAARVVDESSGDAPPISTRAAVDPDPAFRPELQGGTWPVVVTTKPLQSVRNLDLHFPLPPTYRDPDRSPTSLLSHLFGHEGPGSAFARLQDAGHVTSLTAGNRLSGPDQALFRVAVTLTAEGEKRWREVAKVVFDYGRMVCRAAEGASTSGDGDACDGGEHELRRIWGESLRRNFAFEKHGDFLVTHELPTAGRRGFRARSDALSPNEPGRRVQLRPVRGAEHVQTRLRDLPFRGQPTERERRHSPLGGNARVLSANCPGELLY